MNGLFRNFCMGLAVSSLLLSTLAGGQKTKQLLPSIEHTAVPYYPPLARVAKVEGIVHIKVTTDGHKVVSTDIEDGPKWLADAAEKNVQSWEFAKHEPMTFTVTYRYKLVEELKDNPSDTMLILRLPAEVEVVTIQHPPIDTASPVSALQPASEPSSLVHESGHVNQPKPQ
jgi:hypothetical protein